MSNERIAVLALGLSLIAAIFGFGVRIGSLTERIDTQSKQIDVLSEDVRAINAGFIAWAGAHAEPATRRTP